MKKPMLLVFDIDGTLCQTKEIGDDCFVELFEKKYQCDLTGIEWENFVNVTDTALYNDLYKMQFGSDANQMEMQVFKQAYYAALLALTKTKSECFKVVEGANDFLLYCQQNDIPIAIATGSWLDIALLKMNACGLQTQTIPISSSDDDDTRTGIVTSAIEKSEKQYHIEGFEKVIYFGDGLWDLKCCQALNIPFVGIDIDDNRKLHHAGVQYIYPNFKEKEKILKEINGK
jgi:phosphoglycolate phosphatase-like HAD superfamily hydrolase